MAATGLMMIFIRNRLHALRKLLTSGNFELLSNPWQRRRSFPIS